MSLFAELKRRNVVRVAVLYVIAAWVVLQVADVLFGMMKVPEWSGKLVLGLLALGFPIAMVFSWIYEITPEGLKKQHEDLRGQSITAATARRLNIAIGVAAAIAIIGIVVDRLVPERAAPAAETTQASAVGTTPGSTVTSAEEAPSIAVLPFADLSQAKDQEYFADGLSEELLNLLAQVEELRVIGRTSSFQFKGKNEDLRAIGETLDVAHILEGSVRKSGDKLRITAQLIRAIDGSHLWSQSYDRKLDDVFAMQDEIAAAVVGALKLRLVAGDAPVRATRRDTEAYNHYLQGQYHLDRRTRESLDTALLQFQAAVKRDPDDALAWVGLAKTYSTQAGRTGQIPIDEGYRLARQAAERAVALDPELAHAHAALGEIQSAYDWDWVASDASYGRAYELAGTDPEILRQAAVQDKTLGRFDRATERLKRAIDRDPLRSALHHNLAIAYLAMGRNGDAENSARRALELLPTASGRHKGLASTLIVQRKLAEAERVIALEVDEFWRLYGVSLIQVAQGRQREADPTLKAFTDKFADIGAYQIAEIYALREEPDSAFQWLERAYRQRDTGLAEILQSPFLGKLKPDPRYAALLRKLGLPNPA